MRILGCIASYIKMSSSESWPGKVELTQAHSKNMMTMVNILHTSTKLVFVPSLMAMIFIS